MNNESIIKQCLKEAHEECSAIILPLGWNSFRTNHSLGLKTIEAVYSDSFLDDSGNGWNLDFLEYLDICHNPQAQKDRMDQFREKFILEPLVLDIFESQLRTLIKFLRCFGYHPQDVSYLEEYHHGTILYLRQDLRVL